MQIIEQNITINEVSFSFKIDFREPKIFNKYEVKRLTPFVVSGYYTAYGEYEIKISFGAGIMDYEYFCELNGLDSQLFRVEIIGRIDTDKIMQFSE